MSDYSALVHVEVGGARQTVDPGGSIKIGEVVFTVNTAGHVIVSGIPTADPHVAGALWANSGVLTVSAG